MFKRKKVSVSSNSPWFDELDAESKQETCIKYLRSLDKTSLKRLYEAVDFYRQGDTVLGKVKEPELEPDDAPDDSIELLDN